MKARKKLFFPDTDFPPCVLSQLHCARSHPAYTAGRRQFEVEDREGALCHQERAITRFPRNFASLNCIRAGKIWRKGVAVVAKVSGVYVSIRSFYPVRSWKRQQRAAPAPHGPRYDVSRKILPPPPPSPHPEPVSPPLISREGEKREEGLAGRAATISLFITTQPQKQLCLDFSTRKQKPKKMPKRTFFLSRKSCQKFATFLKSLTRFSVQTAVRIEACILRTRVEN